MRPAEGRGWRPSLSGAAARWPAQLGRGEVGVGGGRQAAVVNQQDCNSRRPSRGHTCIADGGPPSIMLTPRLLMPTGSHVVARVAPLALRAMTTAPTELSAAPGLLLWRGFVEDPDDFFSRAWSIAEGAGLHMLKPWKYPGVSATTPRYRCQHCAHSREAY